MPLTTISNLFIPALWLRAVAEQMATFPSLASSGIITTNPELDNVASGPGLSARLDFFKDITDGDEENQVESTAPSIGNITTTHQVCTVLNRVKAWGSSAFAKQLSGTDPMAEIVRQIAANRLKRRNKIILALLRGAFNGLAASGAAAPLSAVRRDIFIESGNSATSANLISTNEFINAKSLMGELSDGLMNGAIFCHTNIRAALEKLDAASFKNGVESGLSYKVETYRGIPIYTSDALVRPGTTNGFVYETYILSNSIIGLGSKPQSQEVGDMSNFLLEEDKKTNDILLFDRSRQVLHLNGMRWTGTPADLNGGATNAELATAANWALALSTANRVGAVLLRTNG